MNTRIINELYELFIELTDLRNYENLKLANVADDKVYAACIQERVSTFDVAIRLLRNKIEYIKELMKKQ